jgi:hypothetical protein
VHSKGRIEGTRGIVSDHDLGGNRCDIVPNGIHGGECLQEKTHRYHILCTNDYCQDPPKEVVLKEYSPPIFIVGIRDESILSLVQNIEMVPLSL